MSNVYYFLKLRANIVLDGDVDLAEREVKSFFGQVERITQVADLQSKLGLSPALVSSNTRKAGCIGFLATHSHKEIHELVRLLNFTQEIWVEIDATPAKVLEPYQWTSMVNTSGKIFLCTLPLMACGELLSQTKIPSPKVFDIQLLTAYLAGSTTTAKRTIKPPTTGSTSTSHVHSLHKYKAKFFPRLIRTFLVKQLDKLPKTQEEKITLLDPFVGSGTALIEASLLGLDSVGIDIDKLSCAISQAKIEALAASPERVSVVSASLVNTVAEVDTSKNTYQFPKCIVKKFDRWGTLEEQKNYEVAITKWKNAIDNLTAEEYKPLFRICLSDALTRKFVIRMMGTGVGRFALEIAKTPLDSLMTSNLKTLIHSIQIAKSLMEGYKVNLGKAEVQHGTAVKLPFKDDHFSMILTSPPYLPASSGREDYLVGKAISNLALNLMTEEEMEEAEAKAVGSMKGVVESKDGLPKSVYDLHNWLANDPLREIKAKPILAYYLSLKQALTESYRVLLPEGLAVYVIGKESVFYRFSDRKVLYRVACDKIFAELAESCGFIIDEKVEVELDKKNRNARPRSLDSYYESIFVLRKR
jgi:hypothetical protein